MDLTKTIKHSTVALAVGLGALSLNATPVEAKSKKAPKAPVLFDAEKRKKTKNEIGANLTWSGYVSGKITRYGNLRRDDDAHDYKTRLDAYLGLAARLKFSDTVTGFAHLESKLNKTKTGTKDYPSAFEMTVKEALVSVRLSDQTTLTAGRMRFQDVNRWIADGAVDGVHLSFKGATRGLELAALRRTDDSIGEYAIAHAWRQDGKNKQGALAVFEDTPGAERLHLHGYSNRHLSADMSYTFNLGVVAGDIPSSDSVGVGFDFRAMRKLTQGDRPAQLTFGLAAGSSGFVQTGLHSNKSYDGSQIQLYRYGFVFAPELTNMAVATVSYGLRPSRKFSVDLTAHAFARLSSNGGGIDAAFNGAVTGSGYLGTEVHVAGAWRPAKKSKIEFGAGAFLPGPTFADQSTVTQVFARYTFSF